MKKILALLLAAALVLSLAACSGKTAKDDSKEKDTSSSSASETEKEEGGEDVSSDPSTWPVIKVEATGNFAEGESKEEDIEKAMNDYLVSINAGAQVDLITLAFGDRATQLTLLLTDPDNGIDLYGWRFYSTVTNLVKNKQCISLEPYREQYPDLWELYPEDVYKVCQVNGEQYSIPGGDSFGNFQVYTMRKDIVDEIGLSDWIGTKLTEEQFEELLTKAEEAHPELGWFTQTNNVNYIGIDSLGFDEWIGVLENNGIGEETITDWYASDEWKQYCYRMKDFADKGFFVDDPLNQQLTAASVNQQLIGGYLFEGYSVDYCQSLMLAQLPDWDMAIFQLGDFVGKNSTVYTGWQISSVCKYPDEAMKILYLLNTDPTFARYLMLGIEGEQYVVDEEGRAWYPEGVDQTTSGWNSGAAWWYPNQTISLPFESPLANYYTDMIACWTDPNSQYSSGLGFIFDTTPVYDEYQACTATVNEYKNALLFGQIDDVDAALQSFNEELDANGRQVILEEMQKQYDEFLGK